jgi:uncharacterized protein YjbI with pentapeptide repeats
VNLSEADLYGVDLTDSNLQKANLSDANLEGIILKRTDLRGVKGLSKEQLEARKAKGAIIDEDTTVSSYPLPVAISPPKESND